MGPCGFILLRSSKLYCRGNIWNQLFCLSFFQCSYLPHFFIRNHLTIFLTPILFLLWNYIITIDCNVRKHFEMYSAPLRIHLTSFWFLITTTNITLNVFWGGCLSFISELDISTIYFIWMMVVLCAVHKC